MYGHLPFKRSHYSDPSYRLFLDDCELFWAGFKEKRPPDGLDGQFRVMIEGLLDRDREKRVRYKDVL